MQLGWAGLQHTIFPCDVQLGIFHCCLDALLKHLVPLVGLHLLRLQRRWQTSRGVWSALALRDVRGARALSDRLQIQRTMNLSRSVATSENGLALQPLILIAYLAGTDTYTHTHTHTRTHSSSNKCQNAEISRHTF